MGFSAFGGITLSSENLTRLARAEAAHIREAFNQLGELMSRPNSLRRHRSSLGYEYRPSGFSGDELKRMRARNGVGRPPHVRQMQEFKASLKPHNVAKAHGSDIKRRDRPWIYQPPSGKRMKGRQFFTEHGMCYPLIFSTAALRKSKRRKGRA